jgi:hypothetical protein
MSVTLYLAVEQNVYLRMSYMLFAIRYNGTLRDTSQWQHIDIGYKWRQIISHTDLIPGFEIFAGNSTFQLSWF